MKLIYSLPSPKHRSLTILLLFLSTTVLLLVSCAKEMNSIEPEKPIAMIASHYGKEFEGQKTANGEIYNSNALTAAHKNYEFGTRLKVTNPQNGKSVIVRINDRGPFIKGRNLDLSTQAAKLLEIEDKGVTKVLVNLINE